MDGALHYILYFLKVFRGEIELGCGGGALYLIRAAGADYRDVHDRVGKRPGHRWLDNGMFPLLDGLEVPAEVVALEKLVLAALVIFGDGDVRRETYERLLFRV